ncbi:MAG: BolA family protein [Nitrospirota bacterium]
MSPPTKETIERKMKETLGAAHVEIVDESWKHAGHAGAASGGHFILRVVSKQFEGVPLLDRNRMVFQALREEMGRGIHALAISALTPEEWNGR